MRCLLAHFYSFLSVILSILVGSSRIKIRLLHKSCLCIAFVAAGSEAFRPRGEIDRYHTRNGKSSRNCHCTWSLAKKPDGFSWSQSSLSSTQQVRNCLYLSETGLCYYYFVTLSIYLSTVCDMFFANHN